MSRSTFGSVRVSKEGTYYGRYRVNGRDYYTPRTTSKGQVRGDLRVIRRLIKNGEWTPPTKRTRKNTITHSPATTVEQWSKHWLKQCKQEGKSPNTLRAYESIMKVRINPVLGDQPVSELDTTDVKYLINKLNQEYAPKTVRNTVLALSACMARAVDDGLIDTNPVRVKGAYATPPPTSNQSTALTVQQLRAVISNAPPRFQAAFALAGWGGLRYGEVAALRRSDVDLIAGTVRVSKSVARAPGGKLVEKTPKSAAGNRTISLPTEAIETLKTHLDNRVPPNRNALLFTATTSRNSFVSSKAMRKALHDTCDVVGVPRIRFHDLRHTALTLYGQAGATLADLKHRAGHADASTVMIYQHASRERDRELTNRMTHT